MAVINQDDYAVVIGVDHYPEYRCLRGAVADAMDFRDWLLTPDGGGLSSDHCVTIFSPDLIGASCTTEDPRLCSWSPNRKCPWFPESISVDPVRDRVERARAHLFDLVNRRKDDTGRRARRLYFYYSGHGLARETEGADLCLANWSEVRRWAALDSKSYRELFVNKALFDEIIFFLDCCRIWRIRAGGLPSDEDVAKPKEAAKTVRTWVVFATQYLDTAREAVVGDGSDEAGVRGIFTTVLLNGLRGAAARPEGGVTAAALAAYLDAGVPHFAEKVGKSQQPTYGGNTGPSQLNQLVFGRARPISQIEVYFSAQHAGWYKLLGPEGLVLREGFAQHGPWNLTLASNRLYALSDENGCLTRLTVPAGEGVHRVDL